MIAITSIRPNAPEEIAGHQRIAEEYRNYAFDSVIPMYAPDGGKPSIKDIARHASTLPAWVCLLNADIIISPRWKIVTDNMIRHTSVKAAISKRWQFDPKKGIADAAVTDEGLDCFCAHPAVWGMIAREAPPEFKLGHILFDTFLLGFLMKKLDGNVGDLTSAKLVFHPLHGDRNDQSIPNHLMSNPYLMFVRWPTIHIT